MKKLRFFGITAAVLLLAFALVVACTGATEPPVDPGPGPDTDGPAYSVPKEPGFTPWNPQDPPPPPPPPPGEENYITFAVSTDGLDDPSNPDPTTLITIKFSEDVGTITSANVKIDGITGVAKATGQPYPDFTGDIWQLDIVTNVAADRKTGLVTVKIEGIDGVDPQPVAVWITGATANTASDPDLTFASDPVTNNTTPTPAFHTQKTTKVTVSYTFNYEDADDDKGDPYVATFDPDKDIVWTALPSETKTGLTTVKFKKAVRTDSVDWSAYDGDNDGDPITVTWTYNIDTITRQGSIEAYSKNPDVPSDKVKLRIADTKPIGYEVKGFTRDKDAPEGSTFDTLEFKFDANILNIESVAATWVTNKGYVQAANFQGTGSIGTTAQLQTILTAGTWVNKDTTNNLIWHLELAQTGNSSVAALKDGTIWIFINKTGIETLEANVANNQVLVQKSVEMKRSPQKTYTVAPFTTMGVTTGVVVTFSDVLDADVMTVINGGVGNVFELVSSTGTNLTATSKASIATTASTTYSAANGWIRNPKGDKKTYEIIFPQRYNTIPKEDKGVSLRLKDTFTGGATAAASIIKGELAAKSSNTFDISYKPIGYTVTHPDGEKVFKTVGTATPSTGIGKIKIWLVFNEDMIDNTGPAEAMLATGYTFLATDFLSNTPDVGAWYAATEILGTVTYTVSGTEAPKWIGKRTLEIWLSGITATGVDAHLSSTPTPPAPPIAASADPVNLNVKIVGATLTDLKYFIDQDKLVKGNPIRVQFDSPAP